MLTFKLHILLNRTGWGERKGLGLQCLLVYVVQGVVFELLRYVAGVDSLHLVQLTLGEQEMLVTETATPRLL